MESLDKIRVARDSQRLELELQLPLEARARFEAPGPRQAPRPFAPL